MPTYNENTLPKKKFKKTNVRSWDHNLVDVLRITDEPSTPKKSSNNNGLLKSNQPELNESSEPESNRVQPELNESSEPESNRVQLELNESSTPESNRVQPELKNNQLSERERSINIPFLKKEKDIRQLIKNLSLTEFNVLKLIVEICSQINSLDTGSIPSREFDNYLNLKRNSRETALKRLCKKNIIKRKQGRGGPNGYMVFSITKDVYSIFNEEKNLVHKIDLQCLKEENNQGSKTEFNLDINSNNNITNLPNEWNEIDIEPLKEIGFSKTQVKQLIQKNEPNVVQESIYHFAYGLKYSEKTKSYGNPLNVLMGVLRKGDAWFEPEYKSAKEIALEQYLEQQKKEKQRLENLRMEIFNADFDLWFNQLSKDDKQSIFDGFKLPPKVRSSMPEEKAMEMYRDYFKNNKWEDREVVS